MENPYTTPSQAEMCCRRSAHTVALSSLVTPKWMCLVLRGAFSQKAAVLVSFWAWFFNVPGAWVVCFVLELPFVTPLWIFQDSFSRDLSTSFQSTYNIFSSRFSFFLSLLSVQRAVGDFFSR